MCAIYNESLLFNKDNNVENVQAAVLNQSEEEICTVYIWSYARHRIEWA